MRPYLLGGSLTPGGYVNFADIVAFIEAQWAVIVGVTAVVAPSSWLGARWLHQNRLEELRAENRLLALPTTSRPTQVPAPSQAMPAPSGGPSTIFAKTTPESERDLVARLRAAKTRVNVFGLTRNFFVRDEIRPILVAKAHEIPVVLYLMDPMCDSRRDRYRLEPLEAALQDPERMKAEVLDRWDVICEVQNST